MRRRTVRDNCDSLVFFIELKPISTKDPKEFAMPLVTREKRCALANKIFIGFQTEFES